MGRKFLIIATILVSAVHLASAQGGGRKGHHGNPGRPTFGNRGPTAVPDQLRQLSPEERQALRRNAERWLAMDPQQRQILRERERVRQEQLRNEVDAALRQSGLRLDPKDREQFQSRYLQERRKIEQALRQEVESKREQELPQLNERLKNEFQGRQGNGSPAASTSPRK